MLGAVTGTPSSPSDSFPVEKSEFSLSKGTFLQTILHFHNDLI